MFCVHEKAEHRGHGFSNWNQPAAFFSDPGSPGALHLTWGVFRGSLGGWEGSDTSLFFQAAVFLSSGGSPHPGSLRKPLIVWVVRVGQWSTFSCVASPRNLHLYQPFHVSSKNEYFFGGFIFPGLFSSCFLVVVVLEYFWTKITKLFYLIYSILIQNHLSVASSWFLPGFSLFFVLCSGKLLNIVL